MVGKTVLQKAWGQKATGRLLSSCLFVAFKLTLSATSRDIFVLNYHYWHTQTHTHKYTRFHHHAPHLTPQTRAHPYANTLTLSQQFGTHHAHAPRNNDHLAASSTHTHTHTFKLPLQCSLHSPKIHNTRRCTPTQLVLKLMLLAHTRTYTTHPLTQPAHTRERSYGERERQRENFLYEMREVRTTMGNGMHTRECACMRGDGTVWRDYSSELPAPQSIRSCSSSD